MVVKVVTGLFGFFLMVLLSFGWVIFIFIFYFGFLVLVGFWWVVGSGGEVGMVVAWWALGCLVVERVTKRK